MQEERLPMNSEMSFYSLGIAPSILNLLDKLKFTVPTQIQYQAIPIGLEGKDMMGIAQTGTGKTLAYGIPMVQRLAQIKGRGLVLVPTRELAIQVDESLRKITPALGIKTAVLIGGDPMGKQIQALRAVPRIIIATPGRLIDHLQQKTLKLNDAHIVVLDEADRMLDMGFAPQIKDVLRQVPSDRQTMLFSATMPKEIISIANTYMKLPIQIEITRAGTAVAKITQELFIVRKELKNEVLGGLLAQYHGPVLIFARTKFGAARLVKTLRGLKHSAAEIHSDRSLSQRKEALEGFKSGRYRVLVATDIASRGIDVKGIELVINYDLPDDPENYVHRIGRTGRAGHAGHAISLATPDQRSDVLNIERVMNVKLPVTSSHPTVKLEQFSKPQVVFSSSKFSRRRRR
jgi:ATP-dependent RNA helicase RhlE